MAVADTVILEAFMENIQDMAILMVGTVVIVCLMDMPGIQDTAILEALILHIHMHIHILEMVIIRDMCLLVVLLFLVKFLNYQQVLIGIQLN